MDSVNARQSPEVLRNTSQLPPVIPPEHVHRTLVLCFDGTGDQFDADNSNIVQLVSLLKKNDRYKQMVYYQAGIGTYVSPTVATPFAVKVSKTLDEMFAWNLKHHVMSGYEFLMQNYREGDKICIFGFSRGAYTARSLAGMINKVGLLPADNHQQVPFAYKMYARTDILGWEQSNAFKLAFASTVPIEFLGVWDTVDSVGLIPKRLPFTTSNKMVKTFRHAIALDERRAKFKANLWNRPTKAEQAYGVHTVRLPTPDPDEKCEYPSQDVNNNRESEWNADQRLDHYENMFSAKENNQETDILEVWFAGCHCDVGGGSVTNKTPNSLARISLRWMVRECFKANTGMMFNTDALRTIGLDPATLYPIVVPRPAPSLDASTAFLEKATKDGLIKRAVAHWKRKANATPTMTITTNDHSEIDEELEDLKDALSPIYDQLQLKRSWWVLEILPLHLRYQKGNNKWVSTFKSNMASPRFIPKQRANGVKVHRTVQFRMQAQPAPGHKKKYTPKANLAVEPTWID